MGDIVLVWWSDSALAPTGAPGVLALVPVASEHVTVRLGPAWEHRHVAVRFMNEALLLGRRVPR